MNGARAIDASQVGQPARRGGPPCPPSFDPRSDAHRTILALASTAFLAASAFADLDLSVIGARVDERVPAATGKSRRALLRLQRKLAKPGVPGLADDFVKLKAASKASERALASDAVLVDAVGAALSEAQSVLGARAAELVQLAAVLESAEDRARCGVVSAKARAFAIRAESARLEGHETACATLGKRAAAAYADGVALATKFLAKQDARQATWSVPLRELGGALLGVWIEPGLAPSVYTVGADDGTGPLFLRKGGEGWVRIPVASSGTLWWVTGIEDVVYASGTGGRVVRYDPATGGVLDLSTGVPVTLYGVWGTSTNDVWTVGGNVDGSQPRTALLHHDGDAWTNVPLPPEANNRTLFKVWGTAADDVWVCGQAGLLMHYDGAAWSVVSSGTFESLFTVHGGPSIAAVGGSVQPAIVEKSPQGFLAATVPAGTETLRGVFVPQSGDPWACGMSASVLRRSSGRWTRQGGLPDAPSRDFHAVAIDDAGGVWLAGGNLIQNTRGVLFYFGPRTIPTALFDQAKLRDRVQPALHQSCGLTGCHIAPFISEGLDLGTAAATRLANVGVPSRQSPLLRVVPGRPSQSYLWHKLVGSQSSVGGSGDRMPQGGPYLSQSDMDAVRAWILEGARDN